MFKAVATCAAILVWFVASPAHAQPYTTDANPMPSGVFERSFAGPAGFTVSLGVDHMYDTVNRPTLANMCPSATRTKTSGTTRVVHEVYGCDAEFTDYWFDAETWKGRAKGYATATKSITSWKKVGSEWKRTAVAERPTRVAVDIHWKPTGPIEYDAAVPPPIGICYWLLVVCPVGARATAYRPVVVTGSVRFEAFSMSVPLPPKGLASTAWLVGHP